VNGPLSSSREHYLFVTGRLAEPSLRGVAGKLSGQVGFDWSIAVLPITVAALMTPKWVARHLDVPAGVTRVMVPGYCEGELRPIEEAARVPVERGPRDLRQLPEHFGQESPAADYGEYDIEILAEIPAAPRLMLSEILAKAKQLETDGADVIVLGCDARETWGGAAHAVRALREEGLRVAIRSLKAAEIAPAARAGAELALSVDKAHCRHARGWGCAVVVVPDAPGTLAGLEPSIRLLSEAGVPWRMDPGLSPIAFGLAESLGAYLEARRKWPEAEMLMDVGGLTETTDVDSAVINVLLLSFCQEIGVRSVLTAQGANWTRSAVRECDLARRLAHYAVAHRLLPKHLEPRLVMLRDTNVLEHGRETLEQLAAALKDPSYRIFAEGGRLHAVASRVHLEGTDPFDLFEQMVARAAAPIDTDRAFYLGYEMAKAAIALALGKNYRQDEALDWGMLTVRELTRLERRALRMARRRDEGCDDAGG